jgi:hypothetical protein
MGATNPRWKKFERDLARDVGTERTPVTGERDGADFATPMFLYSAKFRKAGIPQALSEWLDRVAAKARYGGRIGVLVVRRHRRARPEAVTILRWGDWRDLHAPLRAEGRPPPAPEITAEEVDLLRAHAESVMASFAYADTPDAEQPTDWHEGHRLRALADKLAAFLGAEVPVAVGTDGRTRPVALTAAQRKTTAIRDRTGEPD